MAKAPAAPTVAAHFQGKAEGVRAVYDRVVAAVRSFGPVEEDPKKTSIHLVNASALAGVEVRKEYILLNIKSDAPIKSPRVTRAERLSASRYHQKVKLSSPREVDAELRKWLKKAYELSG